MYKNPVPLSRDKHSNKRLIRPKRMAFALNQPIVPIYPAELTQAASEFPIVFLPENGTFTLTALLSLDGKRNLLVSADGQWLGNYVPAALRRYPFILGRPDQDDKQTANALLCVDDIEGVVSDSEGEPFFEENGAPTAFIRDVMSFLSQLEQNRGLATRAINALQERNLFQPLEMVGDRDGQQMPITGLYRINEAAFRALGDEDVLALHRANALELVHQHLMSLTRLAILQKLTNLHSMIASRQQAAAAQQQQQQLNIDEMFEGGPGGTDLVFQF